MNIFRFAHPEHGPRLGVFHAGGRFDLTDADPEAFASVTSWLRLHNPIEAAIETIGRATTPVPDDIVILAPIDTQEVWAAGVTYERSKVARMEESDGGGDFYDKVYDAERPELFFKSVAWRVSAPGSAIRVRRDSTWDVPEPEMTLVISSRGDVVGLTVGNDVSSRSIEGENPLYLPQAKVYDGACSLGPSIRVLDGTIQPRELAITLTIFRGGEVGFTGETSTARMKRSPDELASWLTREYHFPDGAFLMTGTGIVPPDSFTLKPGDTVKITIEGVDTLENPVA